MPKMKVRAIVLIDYTINSYDEASREHQKDKNGIESIVAGNPLVENIQTDMRERRGDGMPDISKVKVRM